MWNQENQLDSIGYSIATAYKGRKTWSETQAGKKIKKNMSRKGENQELPEGQETTGPLTVATHIRNTVNMVLGGGKLLQNTHASTWIRPNAIHAEV